MTAPPSPDAASGVTHMPEGLARPEARARLLRLLALLPALAFALMVAAPPLNHDVAAILDFANRWVAGERLYAELIDVNPPLIFILTAIPAAIAAWTPLDSIQALVIAVLGLAWLCWRLTLRLREGLEEGPVESAVLDAALPLICLLPAYDCGQREHLMALCALPYLLLAVRRMEGRPTSPGLATGVTLLAALGFALKPHFLAVPALVEGLVLLRLGPRRALRDRLPWTMAAVWLLYLASLPVLFPDYLSQVLPLVWRYYVAMGGLSPLGTLVTSAFGPIVVLVAMVLPLLFWSGAGALARAAGLAALGGLLAAAFQHKGWSYHAVPAMMFGSLAAVALAARWFDRLLGLGRAAAAAPLALAASVALGLWALRGESPWRQIWYGATRDGRVAAALKREVAGERLLVLSPDVFPVYPALNYARAQSTLRTMNTWLLLGVYQDCPEDGARYRETWEMSRTEFFIYRTVAEDFARAPPAGVLIPEHSGIPRCAGEAFDVIAYFSRHPAFAETWQRYTRIVHIENYLLYLRED